MQFTVWICGATIVNLNKVYKQIISRSVFVFWQQQLLQLLYLHSNFYFHSWGFPASARGQRCRGTGWTTRALCILMMVFWMCVVQPVCTTDQVCPAKEETTEKNKSLDYGSLPVKGVKSLFTTVYVTFKWLFFRVHTYMDFEAIRCKKRFPTTLLIADKRVLPSVCFLVCAQISSSTVCS